MRLVDDRIREVSDRFNAPPSHNARELTQGGDTALIVLDDQTYTLRITRQGKLILTK